jgi:DNA repair exonuclease SbcCD ATPase subunit
MSTSSSSQRLIAIATVVIIALLGINGYLLYNKVNQDKLIRKQNTELIEAEKLQTELEKEYYQSLSDLEEMKSNNEELNALIESQKEDLKGQKARISSLLKNSKDLEKAREEIRRMRATVEKYIVEINTLKEENAILSTTNLSLLGEKKDLTEAVAKERMTNEELSTAKATLVSEKELLEKEKNYLSEKVDIASVIRVQSLDAYGYKLRSSGKEAESNRAKSIDGIKTCFNTQDNMVAAAGNEIFYLRILNPAGETLAIEELGSGMLSLTSNEEQIRYTLAKDVAFENQSTNLCMNWQPEVPFTPGDYKVEIYNKGYLAGQGRFKLK